MRHRLLGGLALAVAVLVALPMSAVADQQQVDNDLVLSGNQNIVSLGAVPAGGPVLVNAQVVVNYSGGNHLAPGTVLTLTDGNQSQWEVETSPGVWGPTTAPTGWAVLPAFVALPGVWTSGSIAVSAPHGAVAFNAPASGGNYRFVAKWAPTVAYGNQLTGAPNLVILFTVPAAPPVVPTPPADTTPPVIGADVVGTLGNNGWYTSDVTVSWTVTDPDSAITSAPCDSVTITEDTAGVTITCVATSAGGTNSHSVTIKRDATKPSAAAAASPAPNGNGWNNTDVTVSFSGTDDTSGIASCDTAVTLSDEGAGQSTSGTCTDNAGNVSDAAMASDINIDKTAPSATAAASPAPNGNGWNNTDVTVSFSGTDDTSGIASCDPAVTLSGEGAGQSASGTCTDNAGNVSDAATASGINIDKTAPVVTVSGVTAGASYIVGSVPAASCDTTDALSGVDTAASLTVTGPISGVGSFTATCSGGMDNAGNPAASGGTSVTYSVVYDFCGFKQPLLVPVQSYKVGSTIPVKFCIRDGSGQAVSTAVATVSANSAAQGVARYDATDQQYIFNLRTRGLPLGPLTISVSLDDGTTHSIAVALK